MATLISCTISGNSAREYGGLEVGKYGKAYLTGCTVSDNSATVYGSGGIYNTGYLASLTDCTVTGNAASGNGGGLFKTGTTELEDTIVAGNTGPGGSASDIHGTVSSASSNNLIGTGGSGGILNGVSGNIVLSNLAGLGLAPLGNFGGPTETMALLPGSPAIGAGAGTSGISTDERGAPRPTFGAIDIGAFQDEGYTLAVSSGSPQSRLVNQAVQASLAAMLTENFVQTPLAGVTINFSAPSSGASATLSATSAVTNSSGAVSVTATANGTAGSYTVSASAIGVASPATFNLTNQIQPSFSGLVNQTVTYGNSVTFTGTLSAGQQAPTGEDVAVTVAAVTRDAQIAANGSFSVQFTRSAVVLNASATAYGVNYQYATDGVFLAANGSSQLTVSPEALTITAAANTKVYDGTTSASAVPTITSGSLATGDTADFTESYSAAGAGTWLTLAPHGTVSDGNGGNNYTYTFVPVSTGVITPAPLSITVNNATKNYGASLPAFTLSYSGFASGESAANLTELPSASTAATNSRPVGTYGITASGAVDPNYSISYTSGTLTVAPVALTVTANSASMVYGAALPALAFSYSGFVNGDSASSLTDLPSATTAATTVSPVGSYTITAGGAVDPDYTISYTSGTLTIMPAPLAITVNNASKVYGAALPAFTFSYSGFVNGDNASSLNPAPSSSTIATTSSSVGSYTISASGAFDPNYNITFVAGALAITPAKLTITVNNASKLSGQANPPFTANYSGFANGDTAASLTVQPSFSTNATKTSPAGTYPITAGGAVDANYTINYVAGTLTVQPPLATVKSVEVESVKSGKKTTEVIVVQFSEALESHGRAEPRQLQPGHGPQVEEAVGRAGIARRSGLQREGVLGHTYNQQATRAQPRGGFDDHRGAIARLSGPSPGRELQRDTEQGRHTRHAHRGDCEGEHVVSRRHRCRAGRWLTLGPLTGPIRIALGSGSVPEPSTLVMMAFGSASLFVTLRRCSEESSRRGWKIAVETSKNLLRSTIKRYRKPEARANAKNRFQNSY